MSPLEIDHGRFNSIHRWNLSPAPIRRLQPLGTDGLITWSDGGQLRLWQQGEDGFRRLADFSSIRT